MQSVLVKREVWQLNLELLPHNSQGKASEEKKTFKRFNEKATKPKYEFLFLSANVKQYEKEIAGMRQLCKKGSYAVRTALGNPK